MMYAVDYLVEQRSRLQLRDHPIHCYGCGHDVFIPYSIHHDVEEQGIGVVHAHYIAICQQCGEVRSFFDVGGYDHVKDEWLYTLHQEVGEHV